QLQVEFGSGGIHNTLPSENHIAVKSYIFQIPAPPYRKCLFTKINRILGTTVIPRMPNPIMSQCQKKIESTLLGGSKRDSKWRPTPPSHHIDAQLS
ncbi:hypothetical protein BB560_006255, partial [Smittium megazygosporum]